MSRKRKTFRVAELVEKVNRMLAESTCAPADRWGMIAVLEDVLHESSYAGYRYLEANEVPSGHLPGIVRAEDPANNEFPDETRRQYLVSGTLL